MMVLQKFPLILSLAVIARHSVVAHGSNTTAYFQNDVYSTWWQAKNSLYPNSVFMNSTSSQNDGGVGLFWSIDRTNEMIQLAVVCPIGSGWCGFGITEV
jgi:hypothetical protein